MRVRVWVWVRVRVRARVRARVWVMMDLDACRRELLGGVRRPEHMVKGHGEHMVRACDAGGSLSGGSRTQRGAKAGQRGGQQTRWLPLTGGAAACGGGGTRFADGDHSP